MPSRNIVLYPVFKLLQYTVKIDPNGGVIDHVNYDLPDVDKYGNCANDFGLTGSGYNKSQATYFTASYGTPIAPYTVERNFVKLSEKELDSSSPTYYAGDKYYYLNTQLDPARDGDWGLSPDLRNALYLTEDQLGKYYEYYKEVVQDNIDYYSGVTMLSYGEFLDAYTSYPTAYRPKQGEQYTFMGWYQVLDDGTEAPMPYNFNDPVYGEITLRARWRLDGGYYVQYNPYFYAEDGAGNVTAIIGELEQWTDPENAGAQLYSDQSPTHILRAPTSVTSGWVFRGWRVVRANGEKTYTDNGVEKTYTNWEEIEYDSDGEIVYYSPGDSFTVDSSLVTEIKANGGVIHMQAYYEPEWSTYRRPKNSNLVLDANDSYGGYVNTGDSSSLPAFAGPGSVSINTATQLYEGRPTQILFGNIQSNLALHLYRYATSKEYYGVSGTNFFSNRDGYLLIGFDGNSNPESPTTQDAFIPAFAPDAVVAVTRNSSETLYAMWEPMVYVTFVNTTGEDLTINLSGTGTSTVSIVNTVTGEFDRTRTTNTITVPKKAGDANGRVKIVLPGALADSDSFTATAVNSHLRYKLSVSGQYPEGSDYGSGVTEVRYGESTTYSGVLKSDADGIIVTYTEEPDAAVVFDVNKGNWTESSDNFAHIEGDIYAIYKDTVDGGASYSPSDPTHTGKVFLGWTANADIAAHTDFSSTTAVTWGETTITPDAGSTVLEKIRAENNPYFWDFNENPPYGQTLYAVWSDLVTVTFDLTRSGSALHSWTGPDTVGVRENHKFYRSSSSAPTVTYTLLRGEKVPRPGNPISSLRVFLDWVTDSQFTNKDAGVNYIATYVYDFDAPVTTNITLFTSWKAVQIYTFTIRNEVIDPIEQDDEFDYTVSAEDIELNAGGKYVPPTVQLDSVSTKLKNNETYTVRITITKEASTGSGGTHNWNGYYVYLEVIDRDGNVVKEGHLLHNNYGDESSDYKYTIRVTQAPKTGYDTSVASNETGESILTVGESEFTFLSRMGKGKNNSYVPNVNPFSGGEANYKNVTVTFTNSAAFDITPTDVEFVTAPFIWMNFASILLLAGAVIAKRMRRRAKC